MGKLGNTQFKIESADDINVELDDNLFITMGELNELRRRSIDDLTEIILQNSKSHNCTNKMSMNTEKTNTDNKNDTAIEPEKCISVLVSDFEQLNTVIANGNIDKIYIELDRFAQSIDNLKDVITSENKSFYLAMPRVFRMDDETFFDKRYDKLLRLFDGFLIRNIEEYFYLNEKVKDNIINDKKIVFDYNVYSWNNEAKKVLSECCNALLTVPVELNRKELAVRDISKDELIVYGLMPSMTTANCVLNTCDKCRHNNDVVELKDRTNQYMNVKCICDYCYNVIYNTKPISLLKFKSDIDLLNCRQYRLEFTFETKEEVKDIIERYTDTFIGNLDVSDNSDSTRGHFNKGVM